MKVALISTGILPVPPQWGGAIELHSLNLALALARGGHETHFVTDTTRSFIPEEHLVVHRINAPSMRFQSGFVEGVWNHVIGGILAFRVALGVITSDDFDVIHVQGAIPGFLLSRTGIAKPLVYTVHNPPPVLFRYPSMYQEALRRFFHLQVEIPLVNQADHVISVSEDIRKYLVKTMGLVEDSISFIPNGVDTATYRPGLSRTALQKSLPGLPEQYILFVGQLTYRKGVDVLLEALSRPNSSSVHAVVVGDGPERRRLTLLSRELGVENRAHFVGGVSRELLPSLYSNAQCFVLPTRGEGMPLVLLEALASGLPIVATNIGSISAILEKRLVGFLFEKEDADTLARYTLRIVSNNSLRQELGASARELAENHYSWDEIARQTTRAYESARLQRSNHSNTAVERSSGM